MRRYAVLLRPEAQEDLQNIFDGVLKVSQNRIVAQNFVSRILQRCRRIGDVPHGGRPREDLSAGMRTVPFEHSAVITYVITDKVEIMNIFHGGRDYEAFYESGQSEG